MRLFIAIKLPQNTLQNLEKMQMQLQPLAKHGNFTPKSNLHITLKFIGEVYPDKLYSLYALMDELKQFNAPVLSIAQVSTLKAANIVCAKCRCGNDLYEIEKFLSDKLERLGFTVELRQYTPHVTLIRKYAFDLPFSEVSKYVTVYNKPFYADEIVLFNSIFADNGGVSYQELYSVSLPKQNS